MRKNSEHTRRIHIAGDANTNTNANRMGSFNVNAPGAREKVGRDIKRDDSIILKGLQMRHNFVRPHLRLDGDAPADGRNQDHGLK